MAEILESEWQRFGDHLEYAISKALANSADSDKRYFWCDGIMPPEIGQQYSLQKAAKPDRQPAAWAWIAGRAWMDHKSKGDKAKAGAFRLIIWVSKQAFDNHHKGKNLVSAIPPTENDAWIELDEQQRLLTVRLP